jgi:SAM-dependent methyltransferase
VSTGSEPSGKGGPPLVPVPEVVFHDLECGPEAGDLPLWEEMAAAAEGTVMELGCGTGRVGIRLAREGNDVLGIDHSPALVRAFNERAQREDLPAQAIVGDMRKLHLRRLFPLILVPMQVIQQIGGSEDRIGVLRFIEEHLAPHGRAALAIVEPETLAGMGDDDFDDGGDDPLPDMRELHGWVFSSRALSVRITQEAAVVERLRESVDQRGAITRQRHADTMALLDADGLEEEARAAGLAPVDRRALEAADGYAPSTVVILGKA